LLTAARVNGGLGSLLVLVHVYLNTFPDECSRFFDGQFFNVRKGNFIKHLDAHVVPAMKIDAVFGQGIFGPVDGDGQNGDFHFLGDNEGARLERFYAPVFGSGTLREKINRTTGDDGLLTLLHHFFSALLVSALNFDVFVEYHVPADERQFKNLSL
jgi:hypothetical protein